MVHGVQNELDIANWAALPEVLRERSRMLLAVYEQVSKMMGEWGRCSKNESDDVKLAGALYYKEVCHDLKQRLSELLRDAKGTPFDSAALRDSRDHMAMVEAFEISEFLAGEKEIREGRTISLEQARRELQNKPR